MVRTLVVFVLAYLALLLQTIRSFLFFEASGPAPPDPRYAERTCVRGPLLLEHEGARRPPFTATTQTGMRTVLSSKK